MKTIAIGVLCLAVAIAFGYGFFSNPRRGKVIEAWETTNNRFKISVTAYSEERGGFVPGAYYVFKSASASSDNWREIFTFRHDDPVPIPQQQVHFVNENIGYVFMGWIFAGTTDGGSNWSVWSAEKDLQGWKCCNYQLIQEVRIAPNGTGTMRLKRSRSGREKCGNLERRIMGVIGAWIDLTNRGNILLALQRYWGQVLSVMTLRKLTERPMKRSHFSIIA